MRAAEFTVARAEHELQLARARLSPSSPGGRTVDVVAPVDGVVLKRLRESASVVPVGEPLLEIGDPGSLEIVSDLLSTDAVRVSRGDAVLVEQWGGSEPLNGRVRRVEPSGFMKVSALGVEEQRVNVDRRLCRSRPKAAGWATAIASKCVLSSGATTRRSRFQWGASFAGVTIGRCSSWTGTACADNW